MLRCGHDDGTYSDGKCRRCVRERVKKYAREHKAERAAYMQKYYSENRARWQHKDRLPPERRPTRPRPEKCECCGSPPKGRPRLDLDHCHKTGAFRGWLCVKCNSGIGKLGDNISGLLRALSYLQRNASCQNVA